MSDGPAGGDESAADALGVEDGPVTGEDLHEAFDLIGNETRVGILEALWDLGRESDQPVPFSTLRERVGMRDSGQFNYHLDKLTPRFVRSRDEGYELTYAGKQVIGAAVSGVFTDAQTTTVEPMAVDDCPDAECDGDLTASYGSGEIRIGCEECDLHVTDGLAAPPVIAATHETADLPAVFDRHLKAQVETVNQGFCFLCGAGLDRSLTRFTEAVDDGWEDDGSLDVTYRCRACGFEIHGTVGAALASETAVLAFLYDAGIDLNDRRTWEASWLFDTEADVTSEDPVRVAVSIAVEDRRLDLTLDGDLEILDASRE